MHTVGRCFCRYTPPKLVFATASLLRWADGSFWTRRVRGHLKSSAGARSENSRLDRKILQNEPREALICKIFPKIQTTDACCSRRIARGETRGTERVGRLARRPGEVGDDLSRYDRRAEKSRGGREIGLDSHVVIGFPSRKGQMGKQMLLPFFPCSHLVLRCRWKSSCLKKKREK